MASGNLILDKNLEIIEQYNPALKKKLLDLSNITGNIQFVETNLKEPNLIYNGLIMHSQDGAKLEAEGLFEKASNDLFSIHFILGIGFGYLFKEFCEHAKGKIVLFESNLEILKTVLEKIDFSKELSQPNVHIVSDYSELEQSFFRFYEYRIDIKFSILNSYRELYGAYAQKILDQIRINYGLFRMDYNNLRGKGFDYISSIIDNLGYLLESKPLLEFKDVYKDKTALIVSAGPTLDSNLETIKQNRDKVVIFCVGTALKALMSNGITPDFLNVVEMADCSGQIKGFDISDIDMILEPSTNNSFYKAKSKQKFLFPQSGTLWTDYWGELFDLDISEYLMKGTVSYQALSSAKMLGFKKLVLVGQDLAFVNNSCYSKSASYSNLIFEVNPETGKPQCRVDDYDGYLKSIAPEGMDYKDPECLKMAEKKIKYLNETINFVKGISGEMLPTEAGYSLFIEFFKDFAKLNKGLDLINTSMIGAELDGFKNIPLDKALENSELVEKIELKSSFSFDKKLITSKLINEVKILQEILTEIEKAILLISKYEREIKLRKFITEEVKKIFNNVIQIYDKLTLDYSNNSKIYRIIAFSENLELQYAFKQTINLSHEELIEQLHPTVKEYFDNVHTKTLNIIGKIENNIKIF